MYRPILTKSAIPTRTSVNRRERGKVYGQLEVDIQNKIYQKLKIAVWKGEKLFRQDLVCMGERIVG